jgi:3-deoxy-D-manno-octulosonate 8-phosphate phosphatase (KDO 8-P phosphatase)
LIELLVLDVDGCLTDGKITYTASGDEIKSFDVKDGLAISSWVKMGKSVAIITGRKSAIVQRRAKELGIEHLFQGVENKDAVLRTLLAKLNIKFENVAAIGDDLNDYNMLRMVGDSYAPNNASSWIQKIAKTTLTHKGGEGAVREMIETIIEKNGEQEIFLALWR